MPLIANGLIPGKGLARRNFFHKKAKNSGSNG
jgi:hypothetical protein